MDSVPLKRCTKCHTWQPRSTDNFYERDDCTDGFAGVCKTCLTNDRRRRTGAKPRRKPLQGGQKQCGVCLLWLPANLDNFYHSSYGSGELSSECKNCRKAQNKTRYQENPEPFKQREKVRRQTSPDEYRLSRQRQYQKHSAATKARSTAWKKANPEKVRASNQKRKARKRNTEGAFTGEDLQLQFISQKGLCWWCDKPLDPNDYHIDHRIPLDKGGAHSARNICLTHPTCNLKKNNKMPWEYNGRLL